MAQPTSAVIMPPYRDTTPATTQTASSIKGELNWAAIVAGFMKMLLPMTEPITIDTAAHRPSLRSSCAMLSVDEFGQNAMEMMCALFACYRIAAMFIEPGADAPLHVFDYLFILLFY